MFALGVFVSVLHCTKILKRNFFFPRFPPSHAYDTVYREVGGFSAWMPLVLRRVDFTFLVVVVDV